MFQEATYDPTVTVTLRRADAERLHVSVGSLADDARRSRLQQFHIDLWTRVRDALAEALAEKEGDMRG